MDKSKKTQNVERPERRPYVRPGVLSEEVFETMALSCASDPSCQFLPADAKS